MSNYGPEDADELKWTKRRKMMSGELIPYKSDGKKCFIDQGQAHMILIRHDYN